MVLMIKRWPYLVPIVSIAILVIVMNSVDPTDNIASILLVFLLLYVLSVSITYIGLHMVSKLFSKSQISAARAYYLSSAVGFAPVCLVAMQSLSQLRLLDLALVFVLTGLGVFYIVKRTK